MYLELSRPAGDVSRWEKVLKRLTLLNKNYPLKGSACNSENIQRIFETGIKQFKKKYKNADSLTENIANISTKKKLQETIFSLVLNSLINQECIFFGAYANKQYYKKISKKIKDKNVKETKKIAKKYSWSNTSNLTLDFLNKIKSRKSELGITKFINKKYFSETIIKNFYLQNILK